MLRLGEACSDADVDGDKVIDAAALGEACPDALTVGEGETLALLLCVTVALSDALTDGETLDDTDGDTVDVSDREADGDTDEVPVVEAVRDAVTEPLPLALGEACPVALAVSEGEALPMAEVVGDTGDADTLGDAWLVVLAGGNGETDAVPLLGTGGGPAYVRTTAVAASMLRKRLEPVSATSSAYGGAAVAARPEGALNSAPPAPPGGEKTPTPSRRPAFGGGPCHWPAKMVAVAAAVTCQIMLQ